MAILDRPVQIKKDKSGLVRFMTEFPQKCQEMYRRAQKTILPGEYQNVKNVILCGMGGSAISGELVKDFAEFLGKPIIVNRGGSLPAATGEHSLVILVSYSGNTLETLACGQAALKKKSKVFILTQGGKLKTFGQKNRFPMFNFVYPAPPRAGLACLLMPLWVVFEKLGLMNSLYSDIKMKSCLDELGKINLNFLPSVPTGKNMAKCLAYEIFDRLPIVIAPAELTAVAYRWKTQMAENGKGFMFFETKPEMFHNFIESTFPKRLNDELIFLVFDDITKNGLNKKAEKILENMLERKFCWKKLPIFSPHRLTQTFSLLLLGDWISFYLALLNGIDPTPVEQIQEFKKRLYA